MKRLCIILCLMVGFNYLAQGQSNIKRGKVYQREALVFTDDKWQPLSEPMDVNFIVTADLDENQIKLFGFKDEVFDITSYGPTKAITGGQASVMYCVDHEGKRCTVHLIQIHEIRQVWIVYESVSYRYLVNWQNW